MALIFYRLSHSFAVKKSWLILKIRFFTVFVLADITINPYI